MFSTLRKSRPQGQIENFQKPFQRKTHEFQPDSQQQYLRDRSRRPIKRLKVRSIVGSTYEVDDNEIHEIIHESTPEVHEGPIYIKPVVRVTKKNVFDSILDILHQLLNPPRKELGPIVGPIKMPGSNRKIYLRLLEPVDSSHINVRFVTQVPVPVVDEEAIISRDHESVLPFLPFADPDVTLLNRHPIASNDVTFSSSNRHHSVQLPRNASHVSSKNRGSQSKPATKLKRPLENLEETDKENVSPVKAEAASEAESDKNHLYYQSEDNAVKQATKIIKDATKNEQDLKDSSKPWYPLSTHHLPLRQIAPLYPLSVMEHTDSGSYENTYKIPSDSLTVPNLHSSSYEQYSNVHAEASGFYDQSSYIPNTYATTYQKQNDFSNAPSSYPISYQNQNEFNNVPSPTSYFKQNDLFSAPTTHTSSYEKPVNVPPSSSYATSHEAQNDVQTGSENALRVIDPPLYFLDTRKVVENHPNKVFEHTAIQQQPYNLPNANEIRSLLRNSTRYGEPIDQVIWGKVKREKNVSNFQKNESNFQKSEELSKDNREKWQPLMFVPDDADWHKTSADLVKVANGNYETVARQQSVNRPRQTLRNTMPESTLESGKVDQRGKRRNNSPSIRNSRCPDKRDRCEQTEPTTPHSEGTIMKEQAQPEADVKPVVITPKPVASNTVGMPRSNVITKSSWTEEPQPLVMTTETFPPLLTKVIRNTTEKSIENKTTSRSTMNNIIEKSTASSTTEISSISGTSKASIPRNNITKSLQLPKRPMIMKKPIFILKETESSTMQRTVASSTVKPTMSTTKKTKITTRRLKFQDAVSKTKLNTT